MNVQTRIDVPSSLSVSAFFDWCEPREERYELVKGSPRLQPWVKRNHSRIASNVSFLLQTVLDRDLYDVHQGDFAVATGPSTIRYADVLVERAGGSGDARTAENAVVIIEILSPSTAADDLGTKREEYQQLKSLMSYIVLAQDERYALFWIRDDSGRWPDQPATIKAGALSIPGLKIELPIDGIYRGISV